MTYTFSLTRALKAGYYRYSLAGLGSIYIPKTMLIAEPPTTISVTADGLAEPKAVKEQDPVALQAKADKAAERAQRAAERAQKLAAQVAQLKVLQTEAKPAAKSKKAKAA
jgi:hypothetical protein